MTTCRCSHIAPTTGVQCGHLIGDTTPNCAAGHQNTHYRSAAPVGPGVASSGAGPVGDVVDLLTPPPPNPVEADGAHGASEFADRPARSGYRPEDLSAPDRDTRLAAHSAAGTMILDGELLSGALQLARHVPGLDPRRHFHHPKDVYARGETVLWGDLPAEDQLDYIRGYARAVAGHPRSHDSPVDEMSLFAAGYTRGTSVRNAAAYYDAGRGAGTSTAIVDPDARDRRLVVRDVRPAPERGGYRATVCGGQWRRHHDENGSRDVPWAEGSPVFFTADALDVP